MTGFSTGDETKPIVLRAGLFWLAAFMSAVLVLGTVPGDALAAKFKGPIASAVKKAVAKSRDRSFAIGDIVELARLGIVKNSGIGDLRIKVEKVEGDAILGKIRFKGASAEILIFGAKPARGGARTQWHLAIRPKNFRFNDIIRGGLGPYLDNVTPKDNTFLFATATQNYAKSRLPVLARRFFAEFLTRKGRLNRDGALRLDAGLMYMGLLMPHAESNTMRRIRELIGFDGKKVLLVGRLGLGFVSVLFANTKPTAAAAKKIYVELEATLPPYKASYLPAYIGTTDVLLGFHGSKNKVVGYAIMNMPVCVDTTRISKSQRCKQVVDFDAVISVGKNAGQGSRGMINTWRLGHETETPEGRKKLAKERKKRRQPGARAADKTARVKKDKRNQKNEQKIADAKKRHAERQKASRNPGAKQKATKRQGAGGGGKYFGGTGGKGPPRFAIYGEAKAWKDFFGVKQIDINDIRIKINVYKQRQFSVGYYGDIVLKNKRILIGNNYFFKRVPEIQYIPIPAIYVAMDRIGGRDYVAYCQLLLDVLKVKEKCKTFNVVEDSRIHDLTVKIVPSLAAEADLGLRSGVDITGVYFYKTTEIGGVYGSGDPNGYKVQGYKKAFKIGPAKVKDVAITLDWERGKGYTYAFAGGLDLLGTRQDVYFRQGRQDLSGWLNVNYFDQLQIDLYLEKTYKQFPGYSFPSGYDYRAVLKADFKQKLAGMVLRDPVLNKLLDDFVKAYKLRGAGPAIKWTPVKDFTAGFRATLKELHGLRNEIVKLSKGLKTLTERQINALEKLVARLDKMAKQLENIFEGIDIDPAKLKKLAIAAVKLSAEELFGLPRPKIGNQAIDLHKKLKKLGNLYLKADPYATLFKVATPGALGKWRKSVTWKEPKLTCGKFATAAKFPMKPPECKLRLVEKRFDYKPQPQYDLAMKAFKGLDKEYRVIHAELPKLLKLVYKQAMADARKLADEARAAAAKMKQEIERLKTLAIEFASLLRYVDDVTKLEQYLKDYGKLIEVAKKIRHRLPTPAHFKALKPPALGRLAPFMTGELSITGIDALIKKELRPVEKYFLDILTTLEITAKIVGKVTTLGTVVAVQGTRIGILKAYKEYTKEVGGMLSSGGRIAAYQGELRQAETAILDGLAALNHYAANNQYVDAFNDAMGGYKNQNSLFRVVKAGIVGKFEAGNPPLTDGRMSIDVSIAGTGWSAEVDWDFTKGMKGIFDALKIELVTFLKEETS